MGPGDDLHLVCERRSTSPWHPYPPFVLDELTTFEDAPANDTVRSNLLQAFADTLLTPGARPYRAFNATMQQTSDGNGTWLAHAEGDWTRENGANGTDVYDIVLAVDADGQVDVIDDGRHVPMSLLTEARDTINRSQVAGRVAPLTYLDSTWREDRPSCVEVRYHDEGSAEALAVHVNLARGQVVHTEQAAS